MLFTFDDSNARNWRSVNDNVMGGVSEGTFEMTDSGTLLFSGNLSLENRGGFASIRSGRDRIDLSPFDAIVFRVRGDGRTYYCNLYAPTTRIAYSYRAPFTTKADQWQEVRLSMTDFRATWFGRLQTNAPPLDARQVRSMGFMIADKKAGPFRLEIDWIKGDQ